MKIPKRLSEAVNRRRTYNAIMSKANTQKDRHWSIKHKQKNKHLAPILAHVVLLLLQTHEWGKDRIVITTNRTSTIIPQQWYCKCDLLYQYRALLEVTDTDRCYRLMILLLFVLFFLRISQLGKLVHKQYCYNGFVVIL